MLTCRACCSSSCGSSSYEDWLVHADEPAVSEGIAIRHNMMHSLITVMQNCVITVLAVTLNGCAYEWTQTHELSHWNGSLFWINWQQQTVKKAVASITHSTPKTQCYSKPTIGYRYCLSNNSLKTLKIFNHSSFTRLGCFHEKLPALHRHHRNTKVTINYFWGICIPFLVLVSELLKPCLLSML